MTPFRQSLSWWCYSNRGVGDADLLRQAASIGYAAVELIAPELWPLVADSGLTVSSHIAQVGIEVGFNDPSQHVGLQGQVRGNIELAAKHNVPTLIVFSGNRRDGVSDKDAAAITAQGLAPLAKDAEDAGVTLIIELLNSKVDHIGYNCDHTLWALDVCNQVGSPALKALYDIYHMQIMEGDLIRTIGEHHATIGHYHTAGNPGRNDNDADQEINYPAVYRAIAKTGYTGFVGHEFIPKGEPVEALRRAYEDCAASLGEGTA